METVMAKSARVHVQTVDFGIVDYLQNVTVPADEQIGPLFADGVSSAHIVFRGVAAYMGHPHLHAIQEKLLMLGVAPAHRVVINITIYGNHGFACGFQSIHAFVGTYISGMPDHLDRVCKFYYAVVHVTVIIREQ
jgi:hypothetical protein